MHSIMLPSYSPEFGECFSGIGRPTRNELGCWLYGLLAYFDYYYAPRPGHRRKIERIQQAFIDFDWLKVNMRRRHANPTAVGLLRSSDREALKHDAQQRSMAARRLQHFLNEGLERNEGQMLEREEKTWIHLAARGFQHPRLRVCEQCCVVFKAPKARRCPRCKLNPVRIRLYPVVEGGWHVDFRVGGMYSSGEFEGTVHYLTVCSACGTRFQTTRSNSRHCRNCGSASGRVRRHRGGSRTGRQVFHFEHEDGAPDWSVGFANLDGRSVNLEAVGGLIETSDAEVARHLDALSTTKRVSRRDRYQSPTAGIPATDRRS